MDDDGTTSDAIDDATSCTLDGNVESCFGDDDATTSPSTTSYCFMSLGDTKENNDLKNELKNLSNKLERCYNSQVTFEHMLKNKRSFGDKSGIGFNKKQEQKKLSHFMCYRCHEKGHLANGCPNKKKSPQVQVMINKEDQVDDLKIMKKRTRRGGKANARKHHIHFHDAKMMSKNQDEKKKDIAHIKCYKCDILGHLASGCPNKLENKAQVSNEKQGNEEHQMSNEEKAQQKRRCYLCRERGHMAHSCPL
ncbi:hypothetical protein U9M48_030226, partial [Paspalum notatum var. saurae]